MFRNEIQIVFWLRDMRKYVFCGLESKLKIKEITLFDILLARANVFLTQSLT